MLDEKANIFKVRYLYGKHGRICGGHKREAGGGSQIRGICSYMQERLSEDGPAGVQRVDDPLFAGANGALALAKDMPESYWSEE